jgi:hypothetical protein
MHSHPFRRLHGEFHIRGPVPFADVHRAAGVELVYVDKRMGKGRGSCALDGYF